MAFNGLADVAKVGLIPECAMQVTRSEDGGDLRPYTPAAPCTCYYLSAITGATRSSAELYGLHTRCGLRRQWSHLQSWLLRAARDAAHRRRCGQWLLQRDAIDPF